jgi:hypothetical protein
VVVVTLNREIERMVLDEEAATPCLDASEYIFVSTRLAERFSEVWESSIVLNSYFTTQRPATPPLRRFLWRCI